MSREQILRDAKESIVRCNEATAMDAVKRAIHENVDLLEVFSCGFGDGLRKVGDMYGKGQVFFPELCLSADVMKIVSSLVEKEIGEENKSKLKKGTMVLATVEGDIHDIGKSMVATLIKNAGIDLIDLGRDISVSTIIEKAKEYQVDIIATSALLTTTLLEQKKLEEALKKFGLKKQFLTMVGGNPASLQWAKCIGADGYANDAAGAAKVALQLLDKSTQVHYAI